jgi:hypothetical protein
VGQKTQILNHILVFWTKQLTREFLRELLVFNFSNLIKVALLFKANIVVMTSNLNCFEYYVDDGKLF